VGPRAVSAVNFLQTEFGSAKLQALLPHAARIVSFAKAHPRNPLNRRNLPFSTYEKIIALANVDPKWIFHAAVVLVGFKFCLRANEIAGLTDANARFERPNILHIVVQGKCDDSPVMLKAVLNADELRLLQRYTSARRLSAASSARSPHVLVDHEGCPISAESPGSVITKMLQDVAKAAGDSNYKSYMSHSLRSGHATRVYEIGADVQQLKNFGRWKSDAYTRYIRFAERTSLL
jgi:integrase